MNIEQNVLYVKEKKLWRIHPQNASIRLKNNMGASKQATPSYKK